MRILYVLDGLFMGGAERNTLDLMRVLAGKGHEAHLATLAPAAEGSLLAASGLPSERVHSLGVRRIYDPRGAIRLTRLVRRLQPDCLHVQDPYAHVPALAARALCGVPTVMTRHVNAGLGDTAWERTRSRLLFGAARMAYDRAILVAEALRPKFAEQYGIARDRTIAIHNGVSIEAQVRFARADLRARLGWHNDQRVALMVAVMRPGKGHDVLIRAMPGVQRAVPSAKIVFVGDGPLRPELEESARASGVAALFLGERHDVADLMRAADVVVLPSLSEALPTVLLEAAAVGTPVVASDVGGVSEIVMAGETGLIVPPADASALSSALAALLGNSERAEAMGEAAHRKAETEFSIERQAERTLALYGDLISARS